MSDVSTDEATSGARVEFDPFSDVFFDDPYDMYRRLRDEAPVYHSERYGFWALSRYDDVVEAHKDWKTFSSSHGVDLHTLSTPPDQVAMFRSIIMMDPPAHDRLRALVSRVFTPRAVQSFQPIVREVIGTYVEPLDGRDRFDAVTELSGPFPVEIIARILGVPEGDRQQIRHWLDLQLHREPGRLGPTAEGEAASSEAGAYFYGLVREKRRHPGDDMISRLTQAEVDREDGQGVTKLDDKEIAGFATLLGGRGPRPSPSSSPTPSCFARHPEQYRRVIDDPGAIPAAVEEILRIWPPSQYQGRFSLQDAEFHGVTLPAGHPVLLITGSATRDERFFDDPDAFDIDRPPSHSLGFGLGIHSCLGAALARMESRIAIGEMVRRWPRYEVDEAGLRRVHMSNVAGFSHVPVHV